MEKYAVRQDERRGTVGRKKWDVVTYDKQKALSLSEEAGADAFASLLLMTRGYDTPEALSAFLNAKTAPLSDPFLLKDMDRGVKRIRQALENGERILVYGDYDCDGVTATALLYSYLLTLTDSVDYYIPDRLTDGYGLSDKTAKRIVEGGFDLVVTVDNGIASVKEAAFFKENGVDLVVTDHHRPGDELPDCAAVIDPHRKDDDSPCKELAGVGVAMKLCAALEDGTYDTVLGDFLDLVTIGTIADIVPLTGENRTIVSLGLDAIENTDRPGLQSLKNLSGFEHKALTATSVAFGLAPKINAAGRMGSADTALGLLVEEDFLTAEEHVFKVLEANAKRQESEARILELAHAYIKSFGIGADRFLVVVGYDWHPGVIGIVAARLVDFYGRPAAVISLDPKTGLGRGSARSVEGFSLYDALSSVSDTLLQFGGHTGAAGFSLDAHNIEDFRHKINAYAAAFPDVHPTLRIDCRLVPKNIHLGVLDSLSMLEPFGAENPAPVFGLFGMHIDVFMPLSQNKHIRLQLSKDGVTLSAVYFNMPPDRFPFRIGETVDLAVTLERSEYKGNVGVGIYVRDVRPAGTDDDKLFRSAALFRKLQLDEPLTEEEKNRLRPDRAFLQKLFSHLRADQGATTPETLARRLGVKEEDYGKVLTALNALLEIGVLEEYHACFLPTDNGKKNLADSTLLQRLG